MSHRFEPVGILLIAVSVSARAGADADAAVVDVRAALLSSSSPTDTANALPTSLTTVQPGQLVVLEVWAQNAAPPLSGLACVFIDVEFDPGVFQVVTLPTVGSSFGVLAQSGAANNGLGRINDVGGCIQLGESGVGVAPHWVLVARTPMLVSLDATGIGRITVGPTGLDALGVSLVGDGSVPNSAIDFGGASGVVGLLGDFDRDGDVDGQDALHLIGCIERQLLNPLGTVPAGCADADLNSDDAADCLDHALFAAAFTGPGSLPPCPSGGGVPSVVLQTPAPDSVVNRTVGVTEIEVRFDRPVTVDSVTIVGNNSGPVLSGTLLGNGTDIVTVVVGGSLPDRDRYTVTVRGAGLFAQWEFVTLIGDCDGNRTVNIFDLARIRLSLRRGSFDSACDIAEDGAINIFDLIPVRNALQAALPGP